MPYKMMWVRKNIKDLRTNNEICGCCKQNGQLRIYFKQINNLANKSN